MFTLNLAQKVIFFIAWIAFLYFAMDYIKGLVLPYMSNIQALQIANYFGFIDALNLYFSILIGGFFFRKTIAFWSTAA